MFGFRFIAALLSAFVVVAAPNPIFARAAGIDSAHISSDIDQFLTFVAAAPLTATDRERIATEAQQQSQVNPAGLQAVDDQVQKVLTFLPHAQAWQEAYLRETGRLVIEKRSENDPIRQMVDGTDPVVAADLVHQRLVTEGTLAAWQRACVWMANVLGVPAPAPDFMSVQRAYLKANFASLPDAQAEAIAHIERNYPLMVLSFEHTDAAKRNEFVRQARPLALDRQQFASRTADAMSQTYEIAVHEAIVHESILHAGMLNTGLQYNGLYRQMNRMFQP